MKEQPFEHLLEQCLQDLARTGDVEAVLRRHPQEVERLRPLLTVAAATIGHYADVPKPPGELVSGRRRLLAAADQRRERAQILAIPIPNKQRRPKMRFAFASKFIGVILAVMVGATTIGGGVAMAAGESLPGEALYPTKLMIEDARMELASAPEDCVGLALQFADERLSEIEELVETEQEVPDQVVANLARHVYQAMDQTAWASEEEMPGLLERITQRTRTQVQKLEQLHTQAQERDQTRLESARQVCEQAHEEATAGLANPQTFRHRHQQHENLPEEVTPPETPSREPQGEGQGQGTGGSQNGQQGDNGQGNNQQQNQQEQDQQQQQQQEQDQQQGQSQGQDQQQDQEQQQGQDQDQEQEQEQQQQQDQQQGQQQDQQQQQEQDQQQDQDQDQGQEQEQQQQQDQQQGQDQGQQQDQQQQQEQDQQQGQDQDQEQEQQQDQQQGQDQGQEQEQQQQQQQNQDQGQG